MRKEEDLAPSALAQPLELTQCGVRLCTDCGLIVAIPGMRSGFSVAVAVAVAVAITCVSSAILGGLSSEGPRDMVSLSLAKYCGKCSHVRLPEIWLESMNALLTTHTTSTPPPPCGAFLFTYLLLGWATLVFVSVRTSSIHSRQWRLLSPSHSLHQRPVASEKRPAAMRRPCS